MAESGRWEIVVHFNGHVALVQELFHIMQWSYLDTRLHNLSMRHAMFDFLVGLLFAGAVNTSVYGYSVQNGQVVDGGNRPVVLKGVNWFGLETDTHAPHGLWARNWLDMLDQMQALEINALRIPLCPDSIRGVPITGIDSALNPDLVGLDSVQLLDKLITELDRRKMYVLLDHHRPDCSGQSELWYTNNYSESQWIADLTTLAERYRNVRHVIGIDIKNEPHGAATWGKNAPETDWNLAAENAAKAVLGKAPLWLIFVEGIAASPHCSLGVHPVFWGENLQPLACTRLNIPADRLVLAPHTYGPDVHPQPFFSDPRFPANMPQIWDANFGQFISQKYAVILGEFGGRYGQGGDPKDRIWQDMLVQYLIDRTVKSGFYWSWNPNSADTGGLLQNDWKTVWPEKHALLKRLWSGGASQDAQVMAQANQPFEPTKPSQPVAPATPATPAAPTAASTLATVRLQTVSDWGAGYCQSATVNNPTNQPMRWRVGIEVVGTVTQSWNAQFTGSGAQTSVEGAGWNAELAGNGSTQFGYCALRATSSNAGGQPDAAVQSKSPSIQANLSIESSWNAGYCARVTVRNTGNSSQEWQVNLPVSGKIQTLWRGRYSLRKGTLTVVGEAYNRTLAAGQNTDFGFCALKD